MNEYEKIAVALRHGVLIRGKGNPMSYTVHVTRCSVFPDKRSNFSIPVQAVNAREAARHAAQVVAAQLFPPTGDVSFFSQRDDGDYLAAVGQYRFANGHGINIGVSLVMRVNPVV